MQPKISIVVPVYNVEKYLDRCVQSLRNQTVRDIEIAGYGSSMGNYGENPLEYLTFFPA